MREVELLRETMTLYGLSPEKAGVYLGVVGNTVRRWLSGDNEPSPIYQKAIIEGIKRIDAEFEPRLIMEKRPDGSEGSRAWFGNLSGDPVGPDPDPAEVEAKAVEDKARAELRTILDKAAAIAKPYEREIIKESWFGFSELFTFCRKHGIEL